MRILKLLNKKYLSIILISLLFCFNVHSEEPVDIWKVQENKTLEKEKSEDLEKKNIPENSIYEMQSEKLNELKTENVEPLTSVAEISLKLRSDEVKSKDIREQIIKNSPQDNEDYFVVPKVIE